MIEVTQIRKSYGKKKVLSDITFQVKPGECVAIAGKNGCGKSTLMQIMAGTLKADAGKLCYFGENISYRSSAFHRLCGYVPQENPLLEELTVQDNLKLWGGSGNTYMKELIRQFQLEDLLKTEVRKLSGGMKRRLSIASALVENPPFVLMDEPTTALDLSYKESIHQWMKTYQQKKGIILMTTHDESEIRNASHCLFMEEGKVQELDAYSILQKFASKSGETAGQKKHL